MCASVDGIPWTARGGPFGALAARRESGVLICQGSDDSLNEYVWIAFAVPDQVGTYPLRDNGILAPPLAQLAILSKANPNPALQLNWGTELAGGSGTVTVATVTATSAAGTFSFRAAGRPETGATGMRVVTSGVFNVTF
jgi:hypothetical protein